MVLNGCAETQTEKLPYLGFHDVDGTDTTFYKIPEFSFLNQDSVFMNHRDLSEHIYVADFFYTYCPTICPRVKSQMLRIYDKYDRETTLKLVSFALDPSRDTVERLREYAHGIGVDSRTWHFLTGDKDEIWKLAEHFLISVKEDDNEPGGIFHSGKIMLIDNKGHIRGFAEGTVEEDVNALMKDIDSLIEEVNASKK